MRQFWSDREGNVALVFALVSIPLFGAMGAALDYSMASAYRTDIQKSLDATALALTKIMQADQATLDTVGMQFFTANLGHHSLDEPATDRDAGYRHAARRGKRHVYRVYGRADRREHH